MLNRVEKRIVGYHACVRLWYMTIELGCSGPDSEESTDRDRTKAIRLADGFAD